MIKNKKDLLLEIGVEELPSDDAWAAISQLEEKTPYLLKAQNIKSGKITVYATPRRLVVYIRNIQEAGDVQLKKMLTSLIGSLRFKKTMRWMPNSQLSFSRPIRWLVAMFDNRLVDIEYAGVKSSNVSYGPRFLLSPKIKIKSANHYLSQLKEQKVIIDHQKRKEMILKQSRKLTAKLKGKIIADEDLLNEVVHLVEYPFCILCEFDKKFLEIPSEVAVTVMKKHQRYFPIVDSRGKLLPYFIVVANQLKKNVSIVRSGNEKVVSARLADGEFFYNQDRGHKLEHFRSKLKDIVFHERLGSVYDKAERLEKISLLLADFFGLNKEEAQDLRRAAYLSKADLSTSLVVEFPSLQGEIGRVYARQDKEKKSVYEAIFEHRLPSFSGDKLPVTKLGRILSIADRIDTLAGFFAVNIKPDGSQDPYALRRTALGLVQVLAGMDSEIKLSELFEKTSQFLPVELTNKTIKDLVDFVKERIRAHFKEEGVRDDVARSVLGGPAGENVYTVFKVIQELSGLADKDQFKKFIQAAKRVQNITKNNLVDVSISKALLKEKAEKDLYQAYLKTKEAFDKYIENRQFKKAINSYQDLTKYIDSFFEDVLVMAEDRKLQKNRLALLFHIHQLLNQLFIPVEIVIK
jgi:glycyl-tRNA synthetase beta chain